MGDRMNRESIALVFLWNGGELVVLRIVRCVITSSERGIGKKNEK